MTELVVRHLHAWYDKSHILQGVDIQVPSGRTVAILGRNGAGKTTTLRSIMGLVRSEGAVMLDGEPLAGLARTKSPDAGSRSFPKTERYSRRWTCGKTSASPIAKARLGRPMQRPNCSLRLEGGGGRPLASCQGANSRCSRLPEH